MNDNYEPRPSSVGSDTIAFGTGSREISRQKYVECLSMSSDEDKNKVKSNVKSKVKSKPNSEDAVKFTGAAIVSWRDGNGQAVYLGVGADKHKTELARLEGCGMVTMLLVHNTISNEAFIRLSCSMLLEGDKRRTKFYLYMMPAQMRTLSIQGQGDEEARQRLDTAINSVNLDMSEPASLVVPKKPFNLKPKGAMVYALLCEFASQHRIMLHFSHNIMPVNRIRTLCNSVSLSPSPLQSQPLHTKLNSLYAGAGARVWELAATRRNDSCSQTLPPPPAYHQDSLPPNPSAKKRRRAFSSSDEEAETGASKMRHKNHNIRPSLPTDAARQVQEMFSTIEKGYQEMFENIKADIKMQLNTVMNTFNTRFDTLETEIHKVYHNHLAPGGHLVLEGSSNQLEEVPLNKQHGCSTSAQIQQYLNQCLMGVINDRLEVLENRVYVLEKELEATDRQADEVDQKLKECREDLDDLHDSMVGEVDEEVGRLKEDIRDSARQDLDEQVSAHIEGLRRSMKHELREKFRHLSNLMESWHSTSSEAGSEF